MKRTFSVSGIKSIFLLTFLLTGCAKIHLSLSSGSVAPYNHVILPAKNALITQEQTFEKLLKNNPKSFQTAASLAGFYAAEAKETGDLTRFEEAEKMAKHSRDLYPYFNDRALLVIADVYQSRHQFSESIIICHQVLNDSTAKRGAKMEALSMLITSELALGKLTDALTSSDQLVDIDDSVATHMLRALVLDAEGRDDEALFDFKMAYEKETFGNLAESAKLRTFWGRSYFHRGEYSKAEALFREALKILPGDALALGLLADLESREGKFEKAEADYENAFKRSKQTVYLLGEVQAKRGMHRDAQAGELQTQVERMLRKPLESNDEMKRYAHRNELVKLLLDRKGLGDFAEALKLAKEELGNRRNAETLFLTAEAQAQTGNNQAALIIVQELLRSGVKQAEYFELAAEIEKRLQNDRRANFYLEQAKKANSQFKLEPILSTVESSRVAAQ